MIITTADDHIRMLFEHDAPPIEVRPKALDGLHRVGIKTYAMVAPILPKAEYMPELLVGKVDYVRIGRINYHNADWYTESMAWKITWQTNFLPTLNMYLLQNCRN